jgi:hypothetical protein
MVFNITEYKENIRNYYVMRPNHKALFFMDERGKISEDCLVITNHVHGAEPS